MALAKTKKAAAKKTGTAVATAKPAKAKKAAPAAATKPKKQEKLFEDNSFARFTGYRNDIDPSEVVFAEGEVVYIIGSEEDEEAGLMYTAIKAGDIPEFENSGTDNVTGGQVAPSELAAITGRALEKVQAEFTPVPVYGKLEEMLSENDNPIEVAIELNHQVQETYYWLGGALAMVLQRGAHLKENGGEFEGEEAWNDFCQSEFDFKGSKGHDLVRIYRVFSSIEGFDPSKIDTIGWSKAAIAANYVTPENVDEVIELAETTSQRELRPVLKEKYVGEDGTTAAGKTASRGPSIKKVTLTFSLDEAVAEAVQLAITSAIKQKGIEGNEKTQYALALEAICVEWANEHIEAETKKKSIASKISKAQKAREAAAPAPKAAAPAVAAKGAKKKAA
jgi:hypothetical protein